MTVPARRLLVAALLVATPILSGCIGASDDPIESSAISPLPDLSRILALHENGGFSIDALVPVYLVGFDAGVAEALQASLEPTPIDHGPISFNRAFPPGPDNLPLQGGFSQAPTQPRAIFHVRAVDDAFAARFFSYAAGATVEGGALDANAAEAWLATELPAAGFPLDPNEPPVVILHGGDALGEHSWRYSYPKGWLEPVRAFGELYPLFIYDVSATSDPYVVSEAPSALGLVFGTVFGPAERKEYNYPMDAGGDETVKKLAEFSVDAAHYRMLKGPIYPIPTNPCHHVTLILAVHTTSLTEALPMYKKAADWVDVPGLEGAFENLTGDEVTVELKILMLPQDEPVLDALSRGAGSFATLDALRWYLDENWEKFVTIQEPCEEYLSLLIFGDPATVGAFGGIGTYDVERSHRISFSLVPDTSRIRDDYDGPGRDELAGRPVVGTRVKSREVPDRVNLLYSHETGHLFGMHHPQHLTKTEADSPQNSAFESVWSVMSYETVDRTIDFGVIDRAQWTRNRVGYTIQEAREMGLEGTPEFEAALGHLRMYHWTEAHLALEPHLAMEGDAHEHERLPDYEIHDRHAHPWN
ncbi:MAG: hypothetical protein ACT4PT_08110 [Methanobacteriota archaeon]